MKKFTQRALYVWMDVDSTWILRGYVKDKILANFHVISTYFFDVISLMEKSTPFPRIFFDIIVMVEKSTLFPRTFFDVIWRNIHCVSTYFFRRNFDGRLIQFGCTYFFWQNFDEFDVVVGKF